MLTIKLLITTYLSLPIMNQYEQKSSYVYFIKWYKNK